MQSLKTLSDDQLVVELKTSVKREREATQDVLHLIQEVDQRQVHLKRGFPDLFTFLVEELKYSRGSAYRRVQAMRAIREMGPKLEEDLVSGRISLNTICQVQSLSRKEPALDRERKQELFKELHGKSTEEVRRKLAEISPKAIPQERDRVLTPELVELRVVVSQNFMKSLDELRNLLSHQLQDPHSKAELLQKLAEISKKQLIRRQTTIKHITSSTRTGNPVSRTRFIPKRLKVAVFQRDQHSCAYTDPKTGRRCGSRFLLELDHKIPFALGGLTSFENLQVRCRPHNTFHARQAFGDKWMDRFS